METPASTRKIAITAAAAALVFAATYFLRIPIPTLSGAYFNLGDTVIYLAAAFIGGFPAAFAGLFGSVLADVFAGAAIYVPATAIIKFAIGFIAGKICFAKGAKSVIAASVIGGLIMNGGYSLYETLLFGFSYAIVALPANLLQGTCAAVSTVALYPALKKAIISIPNGSRFS
ncbi:MAG: ECF transporter S component [Clostridiales bacterium]|jgi:uncharacterized membrane protein|nr:ECF transporter S component [Clostridiales bacterium]